MPEIPESKPMRDRVAHAMWQAEAYRAATKSVGDGRTLAAFYDESEGCRSKWLSLADAALAVSAPKVKPLVWEDASGDAMLGRYVAFDAVTPIGRVSYGTDAEGAHWYSYPGMKKSVLVVSCGSIEDAKRKAVEGYEREILRHPVAKALDL